MKKLHHWLISLVFARGGDGGAKKYVIWGDVHRLVLGDILTRNDSRVRNVRCHDREDEQ